MLLQGLRGIDAPDSTDVTDNVQYARVGRYTALQAYDDRTN